MKKQVILNFTSNYFLTFVSMALGFFVVPFLVHALGKEAFGIVVLAESTVAFLDIVTVSVRVALARYATVALAKGDRAEFTDYLSTAKVMLAVGALLVLVVGGSVSYFFPLLFKVPEVYFGQSKWLFFLIVTGFAVSVPAVVYWSVVHAKQRFDLINLSTAVGIIVKATGIFVLYTFLPVSMRNLVLYGAIYLSMNVVQSAMIYFFKARLMPGLRIGLRVANAKLFRELLSFSGHSSIMRVCSLLFENTANVIINMLWGPLFNAFFSVAVKFPNLVSRIFIDPAWSLGPTFMDLVARDEKKKLSVMLVSYSKTMAIAGFPACFFLMFFSERIVGAWVGPGFEASGRLLPFYVAPLFLSIPFAVNSGVLTAFGDIKIQSRISIVAAVMNIVLCYVFGVLFSMKLYGIGLAALLSSLGPFAVVLPTAACRRIGFSLAEYWKEVFFKPLIFCLAVSYPIFILAGRILADTAPSLVQRVLCLAGLFVFWIVFYMLVISRFVLSPDDRRRFSDIFGAVFRLPKTNA